MLTALMEQNIIPPGHLNMATLGEKLRSIRDSGGVSVEDLAKEMGLSAAYISLIERGQRRMPDDFLFKYMKSVQDIVRRRAIAVGLLPEDTTDKSADK